MAYPATTNLPKRMLTAMPLALLADGEAARTVADLSVNEF